MKLSIIILNYNSGKLLQDCIVSIFEHYKNELDNNQFEIIVVDNASSDDSFGEVSAKYQKIRYIQLPRNLGFGKANNQGVLKAGGDYILFLNPDTIVHAKTLTRLVAYLDSHERIGIATCKVLLPDGTLDDACHRGFPTPWRALMHFFGIAGLFPNSRFFNGYHLGYQHLDEIHEIDACAGAFLLIKREVGIKVGWFDQDYFWYGEDLDLCFNVKAAGYKIVFIPDVSILHHKGAISGMKKHSAHLSKIDAQTRKKIHESRFEVMQIFYKKHYQNKYPWFIMQLVFMGIGIKKKLTEKY